MKDLTLKECLELDGAISSLSKNGGGYTAWQADRLVKDGYASVIGTSTGNVYSITQSGKLFLQSGGYSSRYITESVEKARKDAEKRMAAAMAEATRMHEKAYDRRSAIISAVVSGIVASLVEIIKSVL